MQIQKINSIAGAAVLAFLGAYGGLRSPGFFSLAVYLVFSVTAYQSWARQRRKPFWALLLFIGACMPLAAAPLRLCAVALRNIEGMRFNLNGLALGVTAFWVCLGVAAASGYLFRREADQQPPAVDPATRK